jgi:hypothetical protein
VAEAGEGIELMLPEEVDERYPRDRSQCRRHWAWGDRRVVRTDVVSNHMLRWRGWGGVFAACGAEAGDVLRFVQCGPRRFEVRFRKSQRA